MKSELSLHQTEDNRTRIEVRLENETVWLTQNQMAELFQEIQQNISLHLQNIYAEGELQPEATHKEFLSVRQEGNRNVQRQLDFYNLDGIIVCKDLNREERPEVQPQGTPRAHRGRY